MIVFARVVRDVVMIRIDNRSNSESLRRRILLQTQTNKTEHTHTRSYQELVIFDVEQLVVNQVARAASR